MQSDSAKKTREQYLKKIGDIYEMYQVELKKNNAVDFDDMLLKTTQLLERCPRVREELRRRWKHVLVDEWQVAMMC